MTGFEYYLTNNGWIRIVGSGGFSLSNVCNTYSKEDKLISIGLIQGKNQSTLIVVQQPILDFLPIKDYDKYLHELFNPPIYKKENSLIVSSYASKKMNKYLGT